MGCGGCGTFFFPEEGSWTTTYILNDDDKRSIVENGELSTKLAMYFMKQKTEEGTGVFLPRQMQGMALETLMQQEIMIKENSKGNALLHAKGLFDGPKPKESSEEQQ
jgi:hypothetical protein